MNEMDGVWIVDAFTPVAFRGNAAAVYVLDAFPDDRKMQRIAAQMNLSETAFVVPTEGKNKYKLRWFTPEAEVNLCGHATLAATHVLHQLGRLRTGEDVTFDTLSGPLKAKVLGKTIEMDFPALPGTPAKPPTALKGLGVEILACERNRDNYLVEVKDYETLVECIPVFKKIAKMDAQGVIVTTATGVPQGYDGQPRKYDFASRYFCPVLGINEDPVTGSAHCFLGPYWAKKTGQTQFHALQASKGHGILDVTLVGDRVLISGQAITTLKGRLSNPNTKKEIETA